MGALTSRPHRRLRRTLFFGLTFLTAGAATALMLDALQASGLSAVERLGLALFFCLFTWIAGALWTAIAGFGVRLAGRDAGAIDLAALHGLPLRTRTAIVMPVYNEDTRRVEAGLRSIWGSLSSELEEAAFDLFILSDTSDAAIAAEEEHMWERLVARFGASGNCFYRRRTERRGTKPATSPISWASRERLSVHDRAGRRQHHERRRARHARARHGSPPRIGILQSLPLAVGRETLFGRLIQFSSRLQSPMLGSGLAFWQLGESNYWGHNAILRLAPFAQHCGLPHLSGPPPFGGAILSHDFVEAAFMRRAGYEVRQVPELEGSWEEVPANILDYAARDRRWAQGNLQHLRLLGERGLPPSAASTC